ncbi:AAA family ATPase [Actinomadura keratinilytica]
MLLIGPAGAGKTTVARLWAEQRRVPTAHISLDDVREWVRSGFADPQAGWNDHSEAQYRLARRTCGFSARNFLANGISCILDDAVFPDRPVIGLGGWKRHVGPGLLPVVLLPGLEIVLERNSQRHGNRRLSDEEVARIHGRMAAGTAPGCRSSTTRTSTPHRPPGPSTTSSPAPSPARPSGDPVGVPGPRTEHPGARSDALNRPVRRAARRLGTCPRPRTRTTCTKPAGSGCGSAARRPETPPPWSPARPTSAT